MAIKNVVVCTYQTRCGGDLNVWCCGLLYVRGGFLLYITSRKIVNSLQSVREKRLYGALPRELFVCFQFTLAIKNGRENVNTCL